MGRRWCQKRLRRVLRGGKNQKEDMKHVSHHHQTIARSRSPLRPPHQKMEPQNAGVHLHRTQRDLHHRLAENGEEVRGSLQLCARPLRKRRHHPVRRHQKAGCRGHQRRGHPLRYVLRQRALARRHDDQLQDHQKVHRPPQQPDQDAGRGHFRPASQEGSHRQAEGDLRSRKVLRRHQDHGDLAFRRVHRRSAQGTHRRSRGQETGYPGGRDR